MSTRRSRCVHQLYSSNFDRPKAEKFFLSLSLLSFPFPFSFLLSSPFSFSSSTNSFCFSISFLLFFLFLFSSHFPITSSSHFSSFFSMFFFFSPFLDHHGAFGQGRKLPPPFSCHLCDPHFFSLISLFLFMTSYPTWLNMSHGIMPPMWLNVSHSFLVDHMTLAKCHTLRVPCGIPLPCHVSSDTPRLEKREIPTTSESNEI